MPRWVYIVLAAAVGFALITLLTRRAAQAATMPQGPLVTSNPGLQADVWKLATDPGEVIHLSANQ